MDKSKFVLGGTAWINLLNTNVMHNKQPFDILKDPEIAKVWLAENRLLPDHGAPLDQAAFDQILAELASVRELCIRILSDIERQGSLTDEVYAELKNRLERVQMNLTTTRDAEKLTLIYRGKTTLDHISYIILHSIIDTLNNVAPDRLRKCEHEECILHFVDVSKSGRRRWCSMEFCGNRRKAAQFYEKNKKRRV